MTLRAVRFAAGMTVGFVAVFGLAGLVLSTLALSIEPYLPIVTVVIGVVLVGVGGWLLAGKHLAVPGLAGHGTAPTSTWWSQIGYGVSFALASLSCTIAPFLALTASSLRSAGAPGAAGAAACCWWWPAPTWPGPDGSRSGSSRAQRHRTRSSPPPLTCRELSPVGSPVSGPEVCSCSPWGWQHCSPVSRWPDAPVPGGKELVRYPVPRSSSDRSLT